eukprot:CAMPEP_0202453496 /NCGR_PEP_ID=MMETSP1360-20130828/11460_1 /ASSEMBLY_ACC=CAM_ASM_000848 /TAXON_ID=515479 /ORGANISM="Licmophora paradoxa, Strain CCMP2313" /LENGTH=743 /DNA_ID=CAMNT_0049072605 /DNA_START=9 /DNA_END=2240 /DNA_ORIENTATION=+
MPPYPDDRDGSMLSGHAFQYGPPIISAPPPKPQSVMSAASHAMSDVKSDFTTVSKASTSILDAGLGGHGRTQGRRRQRRALMDKQLKRKNIEGELKADAQEHGFSHLVDDREESAGRTASQLAGTYPATGTSRVAKSELSSRVTGSELSSRKAGSSLSGMERGRMRLRGRAAPGSALSGMSNGRRNPSPGPSPSILSGLEDHMITPADAADADDPGVYNLPKVEMEGDTEVDLCCGKNAWYRPTMIGMAFDRLVALAEWNYEMRRIVKLAIPYALSGLIGGLFETVSVALVAHFLGTDAVAAFTIVDLVLGLSSEFFGGLLSTEGTLCSHAIGAKNPKLAGQYVQVCVFIFTIAMIPNMIFWYYLVDDVILLFGFSPHVAKIGFDYAVVLLFHQWLKGMATAYEGLLEVIEREQWCTFITMVEGIVSTSLVALILILRGKETTLQEIGLINLGVGILVFVFNVWYTCYKGWMSPYLEGMVGSLAISNRRTLGNVVKTAIPLAFGYLLQYGEWEILTIFAAKLGPAEVTAWSILGTLWETIEALTEGIADAAEVRSSYHLGAGSPEKARISAYKSTLIGIFFACFFTSIFFILGEDIALWLTNDPTLQRFIADLLPLIGIGNITLTAGAVAWGLVGSQGRYRLATFIAFLCSWGITVPLSALFTYGFNFDLQGIASAVVIGYSVNCTALFYIVLRSDWARLSKIIVEENEDEDSDSDDEEDDEQEKEATTDEEEGKESKGSSES